MLHITVVKSSVALQAVKWEGSIPKCHAIKKSIYYHHLTVFPLNAGRPTKKSKEISSQT